MIKNRTDFDFIVRYGNAINFAVRDLSLYDDHNNALNRNE